MLLNYLKIAFRNIFKNKAFFLINLASLVIGMTCCFLILIWVLDELSFDRFHKNSKDIYRTITRVQNENEVSSSIWGPTALGPGLKEEFPEVVNFTRCAPPDKSLSFLIDDTVYSEKIIWVDSIFFQIFTFSAIEGDLKTALNEPLSLVITRRMARKFFGTAEGIVGKIMKVNNAADFQIKAVIEDVPSNSHLDYDVFGSFLALQYVGWKLDDWRRYNALTYIQLQKNVPYETFNEKIIKIVQNHQGNFTFSVDLVLQPLTQIHLHSDFKGERARVGSITNVYILSIIAVFILLIACVNYMNLSTARSTNRAKEIGIRKVVGAQRTQLIAQFYGESIFLSIVALLISLALVKLLLPQFNTMAGKILTLDLTSNWQVITGIIIITGFTGIIAGSYPAYVLSSYQPADVLKGVAKKGFGGIFLRKALVIFQFALSVLLIISTAVVQSQLQYIKNKDLGYDKDNVMMIDWVLTSGRLDNSIETLKNELIKNPNVLGVAATTQNPTNMERSSMAFNWKGKNPDEQISIHFNIVTIDYLNTLNMEVIDGRGFSNEIASDRRLTGLLNEEAVKVMGFDNPVGETISVGQYKFNVIGVLKDFHFKPVDKKIEPMLIAAGRIGDGYAMIKLAENQVSETIGFIKNTWEKLFPNMPFDYHFLDDDYDNLYRAEERMGTLLNYFAILAVLIACLGLFGLASFTTEQRTKEIGIRKVVGASAGRIVILLSKDFLKLVLIANIIAWPIAYFLMKNWLQDFAYRTEINWLIFIIAAVLSIIIALFTVSFRATKAALANPVESLRYE